MTTDRRYPSVSGHRVTLSLGPKTKPLELQFPWPILSDAIDKTFFEVGKNKLIHLVLKKSLADPWPIVFHGDRNKWNVKALLEWTNTTYNGDLGIHVNAQFDCARLMLQNLSSTAVLNKISPLEDVRRIVGCILNSGETIPHYSLYPIYSPGCKELTLHLKIHLPIRLSPAGVPLLQVSVFDFQLAHQLVERGKSVSRF